jgi:translation initiation factor 2 subunit 2
LEGAIMPKPDQIVNNYENMLDYVYSKIPTKTVEHKRFEIPRIRHEILGRRGPTIIHNFKEICDIMNRDPVIILKFLSKELGAPGNLIATRVTFKGRFEYETFKNLIDRYVKNFIICPVCNSPDSHIIKEKRFRFLQCDACGAKSPVKNI